MNMKIFEHYDLFPSIKKKDDIKVKTSYGNLEFIVCSHQSKIMMNAMLKVFFFFFAFRNKTVILSILC